MSKRLPLILAVLTVLAAVCGLHGAAGGASPPAYKIIVHPSNPNTSLDRKFIEDAFLKKVVAWPGGETIRPVDLPANSPVRKSFSEDILMRSVEAVRGYRQQRIFAGRDLPPPELEADADVVNYVLKYEGAIGYVSLSTNQGECKVVSVGR